MQDPAAKSVALLADTAPMSTGAHGWTWLWFVLLGALVIVGVVLEKKRQERIQKFAAARSLTYAKRDDRWVHLDLGYPHGNGRAHKGRHAMTGVHEGRPIAIFEHEWVTGSGKERRTHTVRVTVTELPRSLPRLDVSKEGIFGRAARRMGAKDIELESDDFNREYRVKGDRRFAYDVLHPRFMQWMLHTDAPGFVINGRYIGYTVGGKIDLDQVDRDLAYLDAVIDQLPKFVIGR